jgi:hypothetical protein
LRVVGHCYSSITTQIEAQRQKHRENGRGEIPIGQLSRIAAVRPDFCASIRHIEGPCSVRSIRPKFTGPEILSILTSPAAAGGTM